MRGAVTRVTEKGELIVSVAVPSRFVVDGWGLRALFANLTGSGDGMPFQLVDQGRKTSGHRRGTLDIGVSVPHPDSFFVFYFLHHKRGVTRPENGSERHDQVGIPDFPFEDGWCLVPIENALEQSMVLIDRCSFK